MPVSVLLLSFMGKGSANFIRSILIGNGTVNMFSQQQIHATIEELVDASFSGLAVLYKRVCGFEFLLVSNYFRVTTGINGDVAVIEFFVV
jgi:hypothetical protein